MKKYIIAVLIALFVGIGTSFAQEERSEPPMPKQMGRMGRPEMMAKLKLTDDQKAKMKTIRFDTEKKEIELRSKVELSRLELGRLIMSDTPDKSAIEKRANEVALNQVALKLNKLNGWFEANSMLSPDQQKIWREVLHMEAMKDAKRGERERMGRPERTERPDHQ